MVEDHRSRSVWHILGDVSVPAKSSEVMLRWKMSTQNQHSNKAAHNPEEREAKQESPLGRLCLSHDHGGKSSLAVL